MGRSGEKKGKRSTSSSGSVSGNPSRGGIHAQVIMGGSNFPEHPGMDSLRNTPNINPMGTPPAGTLGGAGTSGAIPPNIVGAPAVYQSYSPAQPRSFPSVMGNSRPGEAEEMHNLQEGM